MNTKPLYVGIENELRLWEENHLTKNDDGSSIYDSCWFKNRMPELLRTYDHSILRKSETSIRTRVGSALYCDGDDPEVCTPPVRVQKGFTRDVADLLYLARKELVDLVGAKHFLMGYSAHYNLTNPTPFITDKSKQMSAFAAPYSLLVLTPLSQGINMRLKDGSERLELLGDYIEDFDQIRAFLLFYAATTLERYHPIKIIEEVNSGRTRYHNLVRKGRDAQIEVEIAGQRKRITAQDYLEIFARYFKETIHHIGDEEEVRNLDDFISGRKKLEVDKQAEYKLPQYQRDTSGFTTYHPDLCLQKSAYAAERTLPTVLAQFFASLANQHPQSGKTLRGPDYFPLPLRDLTWDGFVLDDKITRESIAAGNCSCSRCLEIHGFPKSVFGLEWMAEVLMDTPLCEKAAMLKTLRKVSYLSQYDSNHPPEVIHLPAIKNPQREKIITAFQRLRQKPISELPTKYINDVIREYNREKKREKRKQKQ